MRTKIGDPRIEALLVGRDREETPQAIGHLILAFLRSAYGEPDRLDLTSETEEFKAAIKAAVARRWGIYYFAGVRFDGVEEPLYVGKCGIAKHDADMRKGGLGARLADGRVDGKPRPPEYRRWLESGSEEEDEERPYAALRLRWWVTTDHGMGDGTLPALAEAQLSQIIYSTNAARPLRYQKAL